jgi:NADPH-dependent glutamate synthase beta subunit-like oxidoreductase
MSTPGTVERPLCVAVIGSGPSGFYAAEALLKAPNVTVRVDVFDRLPTPFGLVRGGVAPDHQKIKAVTAVYEKVASDPRVRFFGNVKLGRDISVEDLRARYHQIIYAVGCESDRPMGIPGEGLIGSFAATDLVGWYNGHPDHRHHRFDFSCDAVAIVGIGNVAMDVARILAQDAELLAKDRRIILRFCVSPGALIGSAGRVEAMTLERNELIPDGHGGVTARGTGRLETLADIGLVFRAVGYRGIPIPGVPFDDHAGHISNVEGRVSTANAVVPGEYVVGWAKRGPSGLVGTNRADSIATVHAMLDDLNDVTASERRVNPSLDATPRLLAAKGVNSVDFAQWKTLDKIELANGVQHGKVREKFTRVEDMLAALCTT